MEVIFNQLKWKPEKELRVPLMGILVKVKEELVAAV